MGGPRLLQHEIAEAQGMSRTVDKRGTGRGGMDGGCVSGWVGEWMGG